MANPEHVALARKGAKAIGEWRQANPQGRLDLRNADLRGASLVGADLAGADLTYATLVQANLQGANLSETQIFYTDLSAANLRGANLNWARLAGSYMGEVDLDGANLANAYASMVNFGGAHLSNANLSGATLVRPNFTWANLSRADFRGASLWYANVTYAKLDGTDLARCVLANLLLCGVDLSQTIGLDTAIHASPSTVGVDTLIASFRGAGNTLTSELRIFLRSTGVPEELLVALPAIVAEVKYHSCFVCYGQPDLEFATKLCQDLEAAGVPCWLYDMDKTVGKRTWSEIGESRRGTERFVALCSAAALIRDGVLEEIEDQINDDPDSLVPISLDNLWKGLGFRIMRGAHDLKPDLVNRNYADFANKSYDDALEELLRGLRRPEAKKARRSKTPSRPDIMEARRLPHGRDR